MRVHHPKPSQFSTIWSCGVQLVGLQPSEQERAQDWCKMDGACTLLVSDGFGITFTHDSRRRCPTAITSLKVKPAGAASPECAGCLPCGTSC